MTIDKNTRLIGILLLLRTKEWVSANELSTKYKTTLRTIYRDIAKLQEYGIPLKSVPGPEGGYTLDDASMFNPYLLGNDEAFSLYLLGNGGLNKNNSLPQKINSLLENIKGTLPKKDVKLLGDAKKRIYFDTEDWYWQNDTDTFVPRIREAIFNQKEIKIDYRERDSELSLTAVFISLGIVWKSGQWYLVGKQKGNYTYCRIRVSRISSIEILESTFTYPSDFDLIQWWRDEIISFGKGDIEVKLIVLPQAKKEMLTLTTKDTTQIVEIGEITIITLYVDNWNWLVPLVLSYSNGVFVERPIQLKNTILTSLHKTLSGYKNKIYEIDKPLLNDSRKKASMK